MAMATSSTAWSANGGIISIPGRPPPRASVSMAAARRIIKASTASTCRRCARFARPAAASSASTPNSSSRPARRSARQVCESLRSELSADLFLASDGPRLSADRPTIFLGCRGGIRIHLDVNLRDGGHHSGNWGGVLANPATILAGAVASLVDHKGRMQLEALKPPRISNQIRATLADVEVKPTLGEPELSENWGEESLSAAERLYAWNTLEVLAMSSGNIEKPANAIPGRAQAVLQLRFVVDTRVDKVVDAIAAHLHGNGFAIVEVKATQSFDASRTDFDSPWVNWAAESIRQTTGKVPAILPNFGGSLPNDVFSDALGLPTIWVPHSYPGCSQLAPDEHILLSVTEEALGITAGLFWDLGELGRPL